MLAGITRQGVWLLATVLLVAAPVALAQVPATPPPAQPDTLRVEAQDAANLSDKDKLSRAEESMAEMQKTLKDVLDKVGEARKERDLIKLNCINEKLTQVKALLRIAEQAYIALQEAVAKSAEEDAKHEYTKIEIARQRTKELRAEAEQCIGQLAYVVDEKTVVTVEVPQGLPDSTTNPPVSQPVIVNPPVLSPIQ